METALGWLGDIFRFIFSLFPHLIIVRKTHAGICWRRGKHVVIWQPGLHVYWPLVSEYELYPIIEQTLPKRTQTLQTADEETVEVASVVCYHIVDVGKILGRAYDPEQTVADVCKVSVKEVVTANTLASLVKNSEAIDKELARLIQERISRYGIEVIMASFSDFAPSTSIKFWGGTDSEAAMWAAAEE